LLSIGHSTTVIVPLTTNILAENLYPLRIRVHAQDHLKKDSDLLMSQIRAIDNARLLQGPLTKVTHKQLQTIYAAVRAGRGMDGSGLSLFEH
jgi:mRNA interferase MazF